MSVSVTPQRQPSASIPDELPVVELPRRVREADSQASSSYFPPREPGYDIARIGLVKKTLKSRLFQFFAILPNQIVFWLVIFTGLLGGTDGTRNFATVITWYIWFLAIFVLMAGLGRAWCMMCPFGGFAEWIQRRALWRRRPGAIGLGLRWPEKWSRWGMLPAVAVFLLMTWAEEYYGVAGPGNPRYTSYLVLFIVGLALAFFLVFERRTFCRYVCPLGVVIGGIGATGSVAGMRTRRRELCMSCSTKDCMRGSERGYPCPWYEWPGSSSSNLMCGLCTECIKNCPHDNVGFYLQRPLSSVVRVARRRLDVAWAVVILFALVIFQMFNALPPFETIDNWLNARIGFPHYPNPVDYFGIIAVGVLFFVAVVWGLRAALRQREARSRSEGVTTRRSRSFNAWFMPLAYAVMPLVAADYLARQMPHFMAYAPRIIPSISDPFDVGWNLFGTAHSSLYNAHLLSTSGIITAQMAVVAAGTLGAVYTTLRIVRSDMVSLTAHPRWLTAASTVLVAAAGLGCVFLYHAMGAAQ